MQQLFLSFFGKFSKSTILWFLWQTQTVIFSSAIIFDFINCIDELFKIYNNIKKRNENGYLRAFKNCIYTYPTYTLMHLREQMYLCTYTHALMCTCIYAFNHLCTSVCMHLCACLHIHIHTYMCICTCLHMSIYTYALVCISNKFKQITRI